MTSRLCLAGALAAFAIEGHGASVSRPCEFTPARNLGAVNSPGFDGSPTISLNEKTLFFTSDRGGQEDLFVSTRKSRDDSWEEAKNVGPVVNHATGDDFSLRLTPDGRSLYFASNRPGGFGKADMYVADGRTLYFNRSTTFDSADSDIWVTTRPGPGQPWRAPERLPAPINSTAAEFSPSLSRNGLTLYFASGREGNIGSFDIWAATRVRVTTRGARRGTSGPTSTLHPASRSRRSSRTTDARCISCLRGRRAPDHLTAH